MPSLTQFQKYLLASGLLAELITYLLYPGWLYFDSVFQWKWAGFIVNHGWPERLSDMGISTHWPLFNTILRIPFYALTGGPGLYIWCQATLVFLSVYLLGRCLITDSKRLALLFALVCLMPSMLNLSVLHASDVLLAALYTMLIAQFWQYSSGNKKAESFWPIIAACTALVITQLLRNNTSLTAIFVAPVFLWPLFPASHYRKTAVALLVSIVIALPVLINGQLNKTAHFSTSSVQGMALRIWIQDGTYPTPTTEGVAAQMRTRSRDTIDIECYTQGIWCTQHQLSTDLAAITLDQNLQKRIVNAYVMSFVESPLNWLDANLPIMAAFSGIGSRLSDECIGRYDSMANVTPKENLGIRMTPNKTRNIFQHYDYQTAWMGFGHPIYLLLFNLLLAAWLAFRLRDFERQRLQLSVLFYTTIAYIAPIILAAPDPQERYYYPFVIPQLILCVAMLLRVKESLKTQN